MNTEEPESNGEKESMSEPQEEFLADSPHELPPQAKGRNGQPNPEEQTGEEN